MMEAIPRTPSPPPPPPSPPESLQPMDLSSERPLPIHINPEMSSHSAASPDHPCSRRDDIRQNHVSSVILRGVPIISLHIDGVERLCLAQISNTLLKNFSYNEIHNRRVALGITCVQCTPVQLEILRRAGAMPISSRRCGMITKREADRLVKSFLEEHAPPRLPDNFAFKVVHSCGWGCKGSFMPSRYNSSRAKCIKCIYCNLFFSPNKFIFHFHRAPDAKYRHPDAANFNSWRRHLELDYDPCPDELIHAWEDVKAMFNGGSRKRITPLPQSPAHSSEKRHRPSMGSQALSKMAPPPNCSMFPPNNGIQNFFSQQPTYPSFPAITGEVDMMNTSDSRRFAFSDMWRPKNTMPYYNPLGLMWAKNFGMCPPSTLKQDLLQNPALRMPNIFMDMNGNKDLSSAHMAQKNRNVSRSSAFRPVGNFINCPNVSPPMDEPDLLAFSRPAISSPSDKSDDLSDAMPEDEDVDVDIEDGRGGQLESNFVVGETGSPPSTELIQEEPRVALPSVTHKPNDHLTSFSIDQLFKSKVQSETERTNEVDSSNNYSKQMTRPTSPEGHPHTSEIPPHEMTSYCGRQAPAVSQSEQTSVSPKPESDINYILNLSKEELQKELVRLMETKRSTVNGAGASVNDL